MVHSHPPSAPRTPHGPLPDSPCHQNVRESRITARKHYVRAIERKRVGDSEIDWDHVVGWPDYPSRECANSSRAAEDRTWLPSLTISWNSAQPHRSAPRATKSERHSKQSVRVPQAVGPVSGRQVE